MTLRELSVAAVAFLANMTNITKEGANNFQAWTIEKWDEIKGKLPVFTFSENIPLAPTDNLNTQCGIDEEPVLPNTALFPSTTAPLTFKFSQTQSGDQPSDDYDAAEATKPSAKRLKTA